MFYDYCTLFLVAPLPFFDIFGSPPLVVNIFFGAPRKYLPPPNPPSPPPPPPSINNDCSLIFFGQYVKINYNQQCLLNS